MIAGLSITVDVDGEAGLPDGGAGWEERLTSRSERAYGITRGLPRILAVLEEFGAAATFYVPGVTALRHPAAIRALVDGGHEVGHHGHTHRRPDRLPGDAQRDELARGLGALQQVCGRRPAGYRAPGWELTTTTRDALVDLGFTSDSSLMGDDRPYRLDAGLLELPVHWTLDDAPYFRRHDDPGPLGALWIAEAREAQAERRHISVTLHPEILGRPHRTRVLRALLAEARERGIAIVTHADVVAGARAAR